MSLLSPSSTPSIHAAPAFRIEAAGRTDKGRVRPENEDRFAVLPQMGIFLVADGMGGPAAGEVAAQMCIDSVCEGLRESLAASPPRHARLVGRGAASPAPLVDAIDRANARIFHAAAIDASKKGMGTTIVAAHVCGDHLVLAHAGDSRAYRWRAGGLTLQTEDYTLVNEYIQLGLLDPKEARSSPFRNIITRAVGTRPTIHVDTRLDRVLPDDVYLLCSDGVSEVLDARDIAAALHEHADLREAADRLIDQADARGGPDNITAVLVRFVASER